MRTVLLLLFLHELIDASTLRLQLALVRLQNFVSHSFLHTVAPVIKKRRAELKAFQPPAHRAAVQPQVEALRVLLLKSRAGIRFCRHPEVQPAPTAVSRSTQRMRLGWTKRVWRGKHDRGITMKTQRSGAPRRVQEKTSRDKCVQCHGKSLREAAQEFFAVVEF